MTTLGTKVITADKAKVGQWIVYSNPQQNQRIVEVGETRDGQIRIYADYGNGGEPATLFFEKDEQIRVT